MLNGGHERIQRTLAAAPRCASGKKPFAGLASHVLLNQ
jgi:hypothetical protein